eukprot:9219694-Ditylum_brightwellii.AAC.1
MKEVVTNLQGLKAEAQNNIAPEAKTAILWIVLLQARHFTQGNTDVLMEFVAMKASLAVKNTCIRHAELPAGLIPTTLKRKRDGPIASLTPIKKPNTMLPGPQRPTEVHPLLQKKLVNTVFKLNPLVLLKKVCDYCNILVMQLCPDKNVCASNMLGKCVWTECTRLHRVATDEEAKHVVALLDKAIANPDKVGTGQG